MSETKQDKNTFTKDDILKIKTEAIQEAKDNVVVYDMVRNWSHVGGKLTPRFKFEIYGGEPNIIDEIALRTQKMMIEIQERYKK